LSEFHIAGYWERMHRSSGNHSRLVLFTVGYAGRTLDELLATLREAGVDRVVDVRALPLSRKKGFSKTPLSEALTRAGIDYMHVRAAGNPFRDDKNDAEHGLARYAGHVDAHPEVLDELAVIVEGHRAALLCMESDAARCHRSVLAARLCARAPATEVRDL
jgi:uncharacterized protein (DUF488 family)